MCPVVLISPAQSILKPEMCLIFSQIAGALGMAKPVDPSRRRPVSKSPSALPKFVLILTLLVLLAAYILRNTILEASMAGLERFVRPMLPVERDRLGVKDFSIEHMHPRSGDSPVHVQGTLRDACPILGDCFNDPESIFRDANTCDRNLRDLQAYYSNSAAFFSDVWGPDLRGKTAAFASFHVENNPDAPEQNAVLIYNVCVHPQARRLGLLRRLMTEGIESVVKKRNLDPKQTLLALDVDLLSPMAAASFSAYAKMGFWRAWQPCASVGFVDWRPVFQVGPPASHSAITQLLEDAEGYRASVMKSDPADLRSRGVLMGTRQRSKPEVLNHYCMFRMYEESLLTMGQFLVDSLA